MQNHWNLGRWLGIPVTMDWTVLLLFAWMFLWMRSVVGALVGSLAFFGLLVAHEFGHVATARWRRVSVYGINFNGMHGETARAHAGRPLDDILVAWGGVGAQLLVLLLTLALSPLLTSIPFIGGPLVEVWTTWNVFLIIIALLPIGPMDGHAAWKIIPYLRARTRRQPKPKPNGSGGKVVQLDAARRRSMEAEAERKANEIIEKLKKK